ncbi:protein NARROW LEAF 1-like [Camellia sinensis]|uniref:protein NARROW LEAF 1-like n=1 Tax=Camellia sinensis TaxID=4442 RepID=UPI00103625A4|nr:protein NARROW LEAF 1-like [Camellia sinensis]
MGLCCWVFWFGFILFCASNEVVFSDQDVAVREQRAASATAVGSTVDDSSPPDIVLPKDKVEPLGLHIQHIPLEDGAVGPDMNSSTTETEFPSEDKVKMGPSVEHQFIPSFNGWSPLQQNNKQDRAASENLSALRAAPDEGIVVSQQLGDNEPPKRRRSDPLTGT